MKPIIWSYWHQGFDRAPFLIQKCIQQVRRLHPDHTLHLLDQDSVYQYAEKVDVLDDKWEKMSLPHRSDLLRTQLLIKHGGVWLDPTVFCTKPFDEWLPELMGAGVFFFHQPGPDRILANWFIAAEPDNYLLKSLYESLVDYWNDHDFINLENNNTRREKWMNRLVNGRSVTLSQLWFHPIVRKVLKLYPYMIYHFMSYRMVKSDSVFREIWNQMPKVPASGPHSLQDWGLLKPINIQAKLLFNENHPLFKLNWKIPTNRLEGTLLEHLFEYNQ